MSIKIQIIERDGEPEYAVLPFAEFERLRQLAEEADDVRAFDTGMADDAEAVPHEVVQRLVAGESPVRVWREYRGLTQTALAERASLDKTYLSQIESGRKRGSIDALTRLADALSLDVDDLLVRDR